MLRAGPPVHSRRGQFLQVAKGIRTARDEHRHMSAAGQIVAFGGGGFSMEAGNPLLDDYVLSLAGRERPRVCFLPTASGDADHYLVRFYRAFGAERCEPSHVSLFRRDRSAPAPEESLTAADVIYVGGGSVVSLLGVWRAHGIDLLLRDAWERGAVLCGLSAGSLCWFTEAVTAFHGTPAYVEGLGLLPCSNTVHFDAEPERRGTFHELLRRGMRPGYAVEDSCAIHFSGDRLERVVCSRQGKRAWWIEAHDGEIRERELTGEYLGELTADTELAAA